MEKKNYWPQVDSPAMINSITAQYVVEGERIIKTMIAEIDRKMIEERRNADWYISDEASS